MASVNREYSLTTGRDKLLSSFKIVSDKMDILTRTVHTVVLSEDYIVDKQSAICHAMDKVLNQVDGELLDKALIGRLSYKLPSVVLEGSWNTVDIAMSSKIASAIFIQYLIDTGIVRTRKELRVETIDGKKVFSTYRYILADTEIGARELLSGLEAIPHKVKSKGPKVNPGGKKLKYRAVEKELLREMSGWEFKLSNVATEELLMHYYRLGKTYGLVERGSTKVRETKDMIEARYSKYTNIILDLEGTTFYLSTWEDARRRMYYDLKLQGLNPQGKLFETLLIDIVNPYVISDSGAQDLIHILMVTLEGRMSMSSAQSRFTKNSSEVLARVGKLDLLTATNQKQLGTRLLLKKLVVAYKQYLAGEPCHYIFGKDLTNSGLGIAANGFRSVKMMKLANYGGLKTPQDSHGATAEAFGLPRDTVKKVLTALLHGGGYDTMAKDLIAKLREGKLEAYIGKYGIDGADSVFDKDHAYITGEYVSTYIHEVYGEGVDNIGNITAWGRSVVNSTNTTLMWNTPDGYKAQSVAYLESVPLKLYPVSIVNKNSYAVWKVTADLPLVETNSGGSIFSDDYMKAIGEVDKDGNAKKVRAKKSGLYANITHSMDSYLLRSVIRYAVEHNLCGLFKHDDYILPLNSFEAVRDVIRNCMTLVYETDVYSKAVEDIACNHTQAIQVPSITLGKGKLSNIKKSENFLMP